MRTKITEIYEKKYLTIAEVCRAYPISRPSLDKRFKTKELHKYKLGGKFVVAQEEIAKLILEV